MPESEPAPTEGPAPEPVIETEGEVPTLVDAPQPEPGFAAPEVVESGGPVYLSTEQPKRLSDFSLGKTLPLDEKPEDEEPEDEVPEDKEPEDKEEE